jgi:ribosomal protein L7/L12
MMTPIIVAVFVLLAVALPLLVRRRMFPRAQPADPGGAVAAPSPVRRAPRPVPPPVALPAQLQDTVRRLLAERKKIQAIKLVREHVSIGLKDAKDLVEAMEAGYPVPVVGAAQPAAGAGRPDLATRARQLKQAGQEVEAVRLVRAETGMGLSDAARFVRALD